MKILCRQSQFKEQILHIFTEKSVKELVQQLDPLGSQLISDVEKKDKDGVISTGNQIEKLFEELKTHFPSGSSIEELFDRNIAQFELINYALMSGQRDLNNADDQRYIARIGFNLRDFAQRSA